MRDVPICRQTRFLICHQSARNTLVLILAGLSMIGAAAMLGITPRLVWNASASAPIGLYALVDHNARRGDLALVRTPLSVRDLAATRGYLPANVPMVKRIAAADGDVVCANGSSISINTNTVAARRERDGAHRLLPTWSGCRRLVGNEMFLLMVHVPDSFDGRYFGPTPCAAIIGKLVPLWTE
jgi:conjugative transfer signal peptidase TraF